MTLAADFAQQTTEHTKLENKKKIAKLNNREK